MTLLWFWLENLALELSFFFFFLFFFLLGLFQFRSRIQRGSYYPTFDEKYSFAHDIEDLKKKRVHLTFWKYHREDGNNLVGEVAINLSSMYPGARMDNWLPLLKPLRQLEDGYTSDDEPGRII